MGYDGSPHSAAHSWGSGTDASAADEPVNTDRYLLFGVLALQADLIDADQFAEACSAWAAKKATSLAGLLQERDWITAEERAHVEFLPERKPRKHGGDARAGLAAADDDQVRGLIAAADDFEVRRSIAELPQDDGPNLVSTLAYEPENRERRSSISEGHQKVREGPRPARDIRGYSCSNLGVAL
jgi:hypothetical protein